MDGQRGSDGNDAGDGTEAPASGLPGREGFQPPYAPNAPHATPAPHAAIFPPPPPPPYGGQHPYPYPYAPQPPRPPRSARRTGWVLGLVAGFAVLVLLGVGGTFLLLIAPSGGSVDGRDRPSDALRQKWREPIPAAPDSLVNDGSSLRTTWPPDRTGQPLVYGDNNGVRGYDTATGRKRWTVATPRGAGAVCAMADGPGGRAGAKTDGGGLRVGAAVFDVGGGDCAYLVVFDADSGHTLWKKNLKGRAKTANPLVTVADRLVMVSIGDTYAAFSPRGGAKLWSLDGPDARCEAHASHSARYVVVSRTCRATGTGMGTGTGSGSGTGTGSGSSPSHQLSVRDLDGAAKGGAGGARTFPGEKRKIVRVLADKPLALLLTDGDGKGKQSIQTYTERGAPARSIPVSGALTKLALRHRAVVTGESADGGPVLLAPYYGTDGTDGTGGTGGTGGTAGKNGTAVTGGAALAALDLRTGKLLWTKAGGTVPVAVENGRAVAVANPGVRQRHPRLVSIDLRSGAQRVTGSLYAPEHALPVPVSLSLAWHRGTLYAAGTDGTSDKEALWAFPAPPSRPTS